MPINLAKNVCLISLILLLPESVRAWGSEGHHQIGNLAMQALDDKATSTLQDLLDIDDPQAIHKACNWPDQVRETPEWEWSAPQHYVNIPSTVEDYDRERDCPTGNCVTEAIKKYTAQLAEPRLDNRQRWEAFAWLCHLVGDLHQPLHTGYRDDRGGNQYQITFHGLKSDLHQFWDRILIWDRIGRNGNWQPSKQENHSDAPENTWDPWQTNTWTSESHKLVRQASYPPDRNIQDAFADQSWLLIQQQWIKAGQRLAQIINASVGRGEVTVARSEAMKTTVGKPVDASN